MGKVTWALAAVGRASPLGTDMGPGAGGPGAGRLSGQHSDLTSTLAAPFPFSTLALSSFLGDALHSFFPSESEEPGAALGAGGSSVNKAGKNPAYPYLTLEQNCRCSISG